MKGSMPIKERMPMHKKCGIALIIFFVLLFVALNNHSDSIGQRERDTSLLAQVAGSSDNSTDSIEERPDSDVAEAREKLITPTAQEFLKLEIVSDLLNREDINKKSNTWIRSTRKEMLVQAIEDFKDGDNTKLSRMAARSAFRALVINQGKSCRNGRIDTACLKKLDHISKAQYQKAEKAFFNAGLDLASFEE